MDYLNYGKKVQLKSPGFDKSWPRFDPHKIENKVQLTKDDFTFGDLNQKISPPPVESQQKDELMQLFPIPVLICPYLVDYTKELEWIRNQECRKNNGNKEVQYNRQSEDTFILDKPEMSRVKQFIEAKLNEYVINIMGSDNEIVITQSWLNKNKKGESHHEHKHPNSIISGVWYPQIHEKLPPIQFKNEKQRDITLSIKQYNHFNGGTFMLPMKNGELILFPSDLQHSVPVNQSDEERISLSFNTWVKGNLGNETSLTYLPLERCV